MRLFALVKSMIAEQTTCNHLQDALRKLLKGPSTVRDRRKEHARIAAGEGAQIEEKPAAIHCARLGHICRWRQPGHKRLSGVRLRRSIVLEKRMALYGILLPYGG